MKPVIKHLYCNCRERGGPGPVGPGVLHADAGRVPHRAGHLAAEVAPGVGLPLGQGHDGWTDEGAANNRRQTEGK